MISWIERPLEERALLNPSFCSCLLWQAATSYESASNALFPFDVSFLVLPFVLHLETRESLPRAATTSLAVWVDENPLVRPRVADRARTLAPFTKEAMFFGGVHGLLSFKDGAMKGDIGWKRRIAADLRDSTDEVRACSKRAEFVGKWFAGSGSPATVMAILGVRP